MFATILVANRGEIACRVMTTARRLAIRSVAVYSEADAQARHVALADEAWPIGPGPASRSYLDAAAIIDAAHRSGAEAIHPGYGFLSEDAEFAQACASAGLVFIGPPPAAIRAMGSKAAAKALMARAGVPLVPGYHGAAQDQATLAAAAAELGYPVLIKASAGGGGRGMRVVEAAAALADAVSSARREAAASFRDDRILIEKYLQRPRHIEVQIFADSHGQYVHLFERDCSIQRRHQKVLEEAPAPGMDSERRRMVGETAITVARAVDYVGAGTVEFITEGRDFYFMEMNTRLQVEHPVTEMITGQDLVEWQLRVAAGERLPRTQEELAIRGHAIEMRLYAEDPSRDFLPQSGMLTHLRQPENSPGLRVESGVRQGDEVTPYYDAMLAKLIAWGEDRAAALRRLNRALSQYEVAGLVTNLGLLRAIAAHPEFAAAALDTGFIARHATELLGVSDQSAATVRIVWAAAALAVLAGQEADAAGIEPGSPWAAGDGWRLNGKADHQLLLEREGERVTIAALRLSPGTYRLDLPTGPVNAGFERAAADRIGSARTLRLRIDGVVRETTIVSRDSGLTVILGGCNYDVTVVDRLDPPPPPPPRTDQVMAPIPARITLILVAAGDSVLKGAPLIVLEAMKTEVTIVAPRDGTISALRATAGDSVEVGTVLIVFAGPPDLNDQKPRPRRYPTS